MQNDYREDQQIKKFRSEQNSLYEILTSSGYLGVWLKSVQGRYYVPYGSQARNTRAQFDRTTFWKQKTSGTLCVLGHTVHHLQFHFVHTKSRPASLAPGQCAPTTTTKVGGAEPFGQSVTLVSCHSRFSLVTV